MSTWWVRRLAPCVSQIPELLSCPCTAQSSQVSICTTSSIGFSLRFPRKLYQPVPSARIHQNSNKPCSASWKTHTLDTTCFQQNLDPSCHSKIAATVVDVSSPMSIRHHHDGTLLNVRNTRNIKIAINDHVACPISNQISQQTIDTDFITSGSCADMNGQLASCFLDVRTIPPESPTKQLSVTSLSKFVQESVIVVRFLETECVGSLEFAKTKVFAQLCHTVTRD